MAIDNFVSKPYIKDNVIPSIIEANKALDLNQPVQKEEIKTEQSNLNKSDNLQQTNDKKPAIKTDDLKIDIKDNNGLAVMGKDDLEIEITGAVEIDKDFIFNQIANLDVKDIKLKPPTFDKERKQYVIKGKAMDVVLGIDVPFEIRMGQRDNKLAIRVDNWVKRGVIYSELKKAMSKVGIESHKEKKHLIIEPKYSGTVNIPVSKEKNQSAKIESFGTNSQNTKFDIDENGKMTVNFDKVPVKASTDPNKVTQKLENADAASVKFDFSTDASLKNIDVKVEDLDVKADIKSQEKEVKELLGEKTEKQIKEQFGDLSSVEIKDAKADIKIEGKEKEINAQTHIEVKSDETNSHLKTDVNLEMKGKEINVSAENLDIKVKEQTITAEKVTYDKSEKGLDVKAEGVDAKVNYQGVNAEIKGDVSVNKKGENIKAEIDGTVKAKADTENIKANIETSGKHEVNINKEQIDVKIDDVKGQGSFSQAKKENVDKKDSKEINVEVKNIDLDGKAEINGIKIDAKVSEGGVKANIGKETNIQTDAKINVNADSKDIKGNAEIKGATLNIDEKGNTKINAKDSKINGEFNKTKSNGDLSVKGNIEGNIDANISNDGKINVKQTDGKFDANFQKGKTGDKKHFDIKGKGESAEFTLETNSKGDDKITIELDNVEKAKADLKLNHTKVSATTKGENVKVVADGDDISIKTTKAQSNFNANVRDRIKTKGTTQDVDIKVTAGAKHEGDDVEINAKNAKAEASIKNKNGRLNVDAKTHGDVKVHIDKKDNINIKTKNATHTEAKLNLKGPNGQQKIETTATGKNFDVSVKDSDGDISVNVENANFSGNITPNERITVKTKSETSSNLKVNIDETPKSTIINVETKSKLSGNVNINNKIKSDFENPDGFKLKVTEGEKSEIETNLKNLKLKGAFEKDNTKVDIGGQGDFKLTVKEMPKGQDDIINVNYKGALGGDINVDKNKENIAKGNYSVDGNTDIEIDGDKINVTNEGEINAKTSKTKFGITADVKIKGTKENPNKVNIDDQTEKTKINFNSKQGGYIKLNNISDMKLGNEKNQVIDVLQTLKLKNAEIDYKNLSVQDNANKLSVDIQAKNMKTFYGNVDTDMNVLKKDNVVELKNGHLSIDPNMNLYFAIRNELSKKGIRIEGTPALKDGILSFRGEVKSDKGKILLADFNVKCHIKDNQLVLDIDDTKVLKVVKDKNIIWGANKVLNYTDIEHGVINKTSMSLSLDDMFKDLTATGGVNFTNVKFEGDRINVGFVFDSIDQDISKLASKKDVNGIKAYMKTADYSKMSGESISTAYSTIAESGDLNGAAKFMADIATRVSKNPSNIELSRGMMWISKNKNGLKDGIMDNIVLQFTKEINLGTPQGDNIIKKLPVGIVQNLANIMDKTITQGGSIGFISSEERKAANDMRKLKGIPQNHKLI
jgi:hypothetical protein